MSMNPHEIFRSEEDYFDWDKYYEQLDQIKLSDIDRVRAREALRYLRGLLGEDFLRNSREKGHPLLSDFLNAAPRVRLQMIALAEALKSLSKADKFDDLLKRIKHPGTCAEALSVLDAAYKFLRAGFTVSFEPVVNIPNKVGVIRPKRPDFKVKDNETGEEIFVEVSRLRAGLKQNRINRTYHVIFHAIRRAMRSDPEDWENLSAPKLILPYAKIHREMDEQEIKQAIDQINELISRVRSTGQFEELTIGDAIEVAVSPRHDHEPAKQWSAARNMKDLVEGPLIDTDEVHRAKVKLREKAEQIPKDKPGIIVVPTNENLLFWVYDVRYVIAELAAELRKYPNLLGMALSLEFLGSGQEGSVATTLDQHLIVSKTREDFSTEHSMLLRNEACGLPVCDSTLEKVRQAFIAS